THILQTEMVRRAAITAGGLTHGGAKMTGGRSPPQSCFSSSWLGSSSAGPALTFSCPPSCAPRRTVTTLTLTFRAAANSTAAGLDLSDQSTFVAVERAR